MKKLNLLSRAEMKKVMGGLQADLGRCKSDVICSFKGPSNEYLSGGCESVGSNNQCRCVAYLNGQPFASVPHEGCLSGGAE